MKKTSKQTTSSQTSRKFQSANAVQQVHRCEIISGAAAGDYFTGDE